MLNSFLPTLDCVILCPPVDVSPIIVPEVTTSKQKGLCVHTKTLQFGNIQPWLWIYREHHRDLYI